MTLITHFRNSQIAVIAGDSKKSSNVSEFTTFNEEKVFRLKDCIVAYFGALNFLNAVGLPLLETQKRLMKTRQEIMDKAEEIRIEYAKGKWLDSKLGFVYADNCSTLLYNNLIYKFESIEIPNVNNSLDNILAHNIQKKVFFSPLYKKLDAAFSFNHNDRMFDCFKSAFTVIYRTDYNLDIIKNNEKLKEFLEYFYQKAIDDPNLNIGGYIGGKMQFQVIGI